MTNQDAPAEPIVAVQKHVEALLASAGRVRAAGLACLVGEEWFAVNVNLTVLHEGMKDPHPLTIESDGICAFDVLLGRPEIDELLANLDAGRLRLPAVCKSAVVPGTAHAHTPSFRARLFAKRDLSVAWPCDEVTIQGGGYQCDALVTRFERFLRALPTMDPPIADRRALERELDIYGDLRVDGGSGHVFLRCPLPVRLVSAKSTEVLNEIEIVVEAYGALAESFRVSVMPAAGRRSASRILAKEFERISESQFRKLLVVREPGAVKVTLTARDGEVADEVDAGVPWAPILVHQQFDPECKVLGTLLVGAVGRGRRDPREFESGVAWLLHLCGCAAMHMGSKVGGMDLQGAPDVVARTPEGGLLIAECSLLGPTELKVEKLRERALAVAALLQRAGVPSRIRVAFFVGEPCDATFEGVEILDLVRLKDMLRRLHAGRFDGFCW
jgi:hypothetical protein